MDNNGAEVEVPLPALQEPGLEYLAEAVVEVVLPDGTVRPLFTGLVNAVELSSTTARISITGLETELSEMRMGGLAVMGARPVEVIYSLLRLSGLPDERMQLDGWTGSDPDVFLVAVPIEGVRVSASQAVFDTSITPSNPAQILVGPGDLHDQFTAGNCWASTTVPAGSLFEAERRGLDAIEDALSALHAFCAFSYSSLHGEVRAFVRDRTRVRIRRSAAVFTGSVTRPRQWLRSLADSIDLPTPEVDTDAALLATLHPDERLRRALREWRSAASSETPFERVTHLWRAIEVYASGASADPLFGADALRVVRAALVTVEDLSQQQRQRLDDLASHLNDAPLMARLRAALERDQIPVSDSEVTLLKKTREVRNALEHAREITLVQDRALAQALGLVNRILVTAASGRRKQPPNV